MSTFSKVQEDACDQSCNSEMGESFPHLNVMETFALEKIV